MSGAVIGEFGVESKDSRTVFFVKDDGIESS
jgi:hypothetical protein